jgi:hypothetical protein
MFILNIMYKQVRYHIHLDAEIYWYLLVISFYYYFSITLFFKYVQTSFANK